MSEQPMRLRDYVPHARESVGKRWPVTAKEWSRMQAGYKPMYWRKHGLPRPWPAEIEHVGVHRLIRYVEGASVEEIAAEEGRTPAAIRASMEIVARRLAYKCLRPG